MDVSLEHVRMKRANKYLVFTGAVVIFIVIIGLTNNFKTIEKFVADVLYQLENTTKNSYIENELSIAEMAPSVAYPDQVIPHKRLTPGVDVSKAHVFDEYKKGVTVSSSSIDSGYSNNENYTINRCDIPPPSVYPKKYAQCVNNSYKTHTMSECRANELC
jgi:hypothetical protein